MRKVLIVTLAVVSVVVFSVSAVAQEKETQKSPPMGTETKEPLAAAKNSGHATEQLMTGKVTQVDEKANTFTVMAKGKEVIFSAGKLKALPKVGAIVDITYTQTTPGGPLESINLNSSRSNVY